MRSVDPLRGVIVQQNNIAQVWQKRCCNYFTGNLWIIHLWFGSHLGGYWFHSNEEVSMAANGRAPYFPQWYFKLLPRWDMCIN